MRWDDDRGNAMLNLRSLLKSGRFDAALEDTCGHYRYGKVGILAVPFKGGRARKEGRRGLGVMDTGNYTRGRPAVSSLLGPAQKLEVVY